MPLNILTNANVHVTPQPDYNVAGFNVKSIKGLLAWYDASDLSSIILGGALPRCTVEQWRDKSGNNRHATPQTSPETHYEYLYGCLTNKSGGQLPGIRGNALQTYMSIANLNLATSATIIVCGSSHRASGVGSNGTNFVDFALSSQVSGSGNNGVSVEIFNTFVNSSSAQWNVDLNTGGSLNSGSRNGTTSVYTTGINEPSIFETTVSGLTGSTPPYFGSSTDTATGYRSKYVYYEVIIASGNLSSTILTNILNYLNAKWNVYVSGGNATPAIVVNSPVTNQIIGVAKGGTTATVTISGTYNASGSILPTSIQARLVTNNTPSPSWTTIVSTPSGGTFSGSLTSQAMGFGYLEVRYGNDITKYTRVPYVGVGRIYGLMGQSNCVGRGTNNQVYSAGPQDMPKACMYNSCYEWSELIDPSHYWGLNADVPNNAASNNNFGFSEGSCWPLLAQQIFANKSYPVAFVPCAIQGTVVNDWQPGASHTDVTTCYGAAVNRCQKAGTLTGVFWYQGEYDANQNTTTATYTTKLQTIATAVNTDLSCQLMPGILHHSTNNTNAQELLINTALNNLWGFGTNIVAGANMSTSSNSPNPGAGLTSDDGYHLETNAKLLTFATDPTYGWYQAMVTAGWL